MGKVKDYLTKAGTTIFVASIVMWVLLNFGPHGYTTEMVDSFGAVLGHWLVPFFEPIGLGYWQIAVALIAGISAKEVVVSSCAVLFGIPNITSEAGMNTLVGILGTAGFGQLNAFCLMIFVCSIYHVQQQWQQSREKQEVGSGCVFQQYFSLLLHGE